MDFAEGDKIPEFQVGPENHFVCVPDIPLGIMQQIKGFKNIEEKISETGNMEPVLQIFDQLLETQSAILFRELVGSRVIGFKRISKIIPWILEEYGMGRPTQPSSPSLSGSSDDGTGTSSSLGQPGGVLMLGSSQESLQDAL